MFNFFADVKTTNDRAIDLRNENPYFQGWKAYGEGTGSQQYYEHIAPYHLNPEIPILNWHPTLLARYVPPLDIPFAEVFIGRHIRHVRGVPRENDELYQSYTLALLREIDPHPTEHLEKGKIYLDIEDEHIIYSVIDPYRKVQKGIITQKDLRDSKMPTAEEGLKGFEKIKNAIIAVTTFREHTLPRYDHVEPRSGVPTTLGWVNYYYYIGSIMLVARPGMEEAATKIIEDAMGRDANLHLEHLPNKTYDLRKRWGFTSNVRVHTERPYFNAVMNFLNFLHPMDPQMKEEVTKILSLMSYNQRGEIPERIKNNESRLYFPYNKGDSIRYYIDNYLHFRAEEHITIKLEIPPIHQAMLENDYAKVAEMLLENPHSVNVMDNRGFEAHELARLLKSRKMIELCVEAKDKIGPTHDDDAQIQRYYKERLAKPWSMKGKDYSRWLSADDKKGHDERVKKYFAIPTLEPRTQLHKACVEGNENVVKGILKIEPQRIQETDSLGFTPLALAITSDNVNLVRWLIQAGAKIELSRFRKKYISLTRHAKSANMMELLLYYHCKADRVSHRLISAIDTFDLKMVKILLRHLTVLPASRGLNAVEYAILACQSGREESFEILQLLLQHYPNYVAEGPYNRDIPQEAIHIIKMHNASLKKAHEIRAARPKFSRREYSFEKQEIAEEFVHKKGNLTSVILPLNVLMNSSNPKTCKLREDVLSICMNVFKLNESFNNNRKNAKDSAHKNLAYYSEKLHQLLQESVDDAALKAYIKTEELNSEVGDNKFINLFFVNDCGQERLVSFLAFQLIESEDEDPDYGKFSLFYVKLAGGYGEYAHYGSSKLSLRLPVALSLLQMQKKRSDEERKYFTLIETLPPGFALSYFPTLVNFFPKVSMKEGFLQRVKNMVKISSDGKAIDVKFEVKSNRFPKALTPYLQFHQDMMCKEQNVGKSKDKAILVLLENDKDVLERYMHEFEAYGVNRDQLLKLGEDFSWSRKQEFWPGLRAKM